MTIVNRLITVRTLLALAMTLALLRFAGAEEPPETAIPPGPGVYMGRTIATTMHYTGAPWLVRGLRAREEGTALMLGELAVVPGTTICDMGCGNGYYTIPLAQLTGPEGRVYAVDIQPEMLRMLEGAAGRAGVDNIEPTLGTVVDPKLPDGAVDLMLLVDVYHEMSHPEQMLAAIRRSLAPGGRLVLVEFRAEDPEVPIKPLHKMSRAQVLKELTANGFRLAGEFDGLPMQHMMTFTVDDPMAAFARMEGGAWRVTLRSGANQFVRWTRGPGGHSMLMQTYGAGGGGEPWRALRVFYRHPGGDEVRFLGLSPFARGVSEGVMRFEGDTADAHFDLHQTGGRRAMGRRWTFDGPDRYLDTLLEATGVPGHDPPDAPQWIEPPLGVWEYVRTATLTWTDPRPDAEPPRPSEHLRPFESLLGRTWDAVGDPGDGDEPALRTTLEYVPYADGIILRTVIPAAGGLDTYLYHHTGTGRLQCLVLSAGGAVYEGVVSVLDGGAVRIDLTGHDGERDLRRLARLDAEEDGGLRLRVWSLDGGGRTILLDARHRAVAPGDAGS